VGTRARSASVSTQFRDRYIPLFLHILFILDFLHILFTKILKASKAAMAKIPNFRGRGLELCIKLSGTLTPYIWIQISHCPLSNTFI
jgi:hypothetical protein